MLLSSRCATVKMRILHFLHTLRKQYCKYEIKSFNKMTTGISHLYLVLAEQEWKQHEQPSIMNDPPHINGSLSQTLCVAWKHVTVLCHKQGLVRSSRLSHCLCHIKELPSVYDFKLKRMINVNVERWINSIWLKADQMKKSVSNEDGIMHIPIKFFQEVASSACLQLLGHAINTALCFMPPKPADWIKLEKPSLKLEHTTIWQKPFVFSEDMAALTFCKEGKIGLKLYKHLKTDFHFCNIIAWKSLKCSFVLTVSARLASPLRLI